MKVQEKQIRWNCETWTKLIKSIRLFRIVFDVNTSKKKMITMNTLS